MRVKMTSKINIFQILGIQNDKLVKILLLRPMLSTIQEFLQGVCLKRNLVVLKVSLSQLISRGTLVQKD